MGSNSVRALISLIFFFSSRRRHTRSLCDWSSDVCSSDLRQRVRHEFLYQRRVAPGTPRRVPAWLCAGRSEERREGKSVDVGGGGSTEKKKGKRLAGIRAVTTEERYTRRRPRRGGERSGEQ